MSEVDRMSYAAVRELEWRGLKWTANAWQAPSSKSPVAAVPIEFLATAVALHD